MRKPNWRVTIVGLALIVLAVAFFAGMAVTARLSNDPVAMMQTVGVTSGAVGAIGAVMAIFGFAGSRRPDGA